MSALGALGLGIGWRAEIAGVVDGLEGLAWVEVVAEHLGEGGVPPALEKLRARGIPVVPHAISLSLGGAEPLDSARVDRLGRIAEALDAPLVSEHIAFVRAGGREAGHLLPVARTRVGLETVVDNVLDAQSALPVPLALEHVASLLEWPDAEMDEATFLSEVLERTGAPLLLDVSNLYANARNHGFEVAGWLDCVPLERIAYVHVGGGLERDGLYHDTHAHPIVDGVLDLVEELCARVAPAGVMLERDDRFPPRAGLAAELDAIGRAAARGAARRDG